MKLNLAYRSSKCRLEHKGDCHIDLPTAILGASQDGYRLGLFLRFNETCAMFL